MTYKLSQIERQAAEVAQIEKDIADARAAQLNPADPATPIETPPEPVVAPPEPPPPQPPAPAPVVDWESRYRSLEGKYRAEVPRLQSEVKALTTQLATALSQIESLKQPPAPVTPSAPLVTDKDTETFGADLIDLIARKATELFGAREQTLKAQIDALQSENDAVKQQISGVTQSQQQNLQQAYLNKLTALVPTWEKVNSDPAFLVWLQEVDPMSGLTRQAYVDNAYNALDADRTAVIFNAWISKAPAEPVAPAPVVPNPAVQRQVEPGKSRNASVQLTPDAGSKIWSTTEIERFYSDMRAGAYTPEDAKRIEAEIDLAVGTGRVK